MTDWTFSTKPVLRSEEYLERNSAHIHGVRDDRLTGYATENVVPLTPADEAVLREVTQPTTRAVDHLERERLCDEVFGSMVDCE